MFTHCYSLQGDPEENLYLLYREIDKTTGVLATGHQLKNNRKTFMQLKIFWDYLLLMDSNSFGTQSLSVLYKGHLSCEGLLEFFQSANTA